ncbi:hypothetical protein PRZ48_000520 [Zasmidium cellare]|uniref:BHLH domain-containing protein n=1 Tax=Zasmidium cellare TaxID=395010 RepID=A0ABR0EYQ4_ZASCE|nr:hypothetical protein PRZ48_000520 [Zasmidium cellare]
MAVVLDQRLPQNLEPGYGLGDYQYGDAGELGTPPDGPPLLDNNDQSILSSFFNDPNTITSNLIPFDTGLPPDHEANGGFMYQFGSSGSALGSLHHKTHVNGNNLHIGHTEHWNQAPAQQHMNADDISAASTIHNLKAPTPTPNYSGLHVPGISASWGNFAMPTPIQNSAHIASVPGQAQLRAVPTQTRHHSFTYPNQPVYPQNQMFAPQPQPPPSDAAHGQQSRPRHMSYGEQPLHQWSDFQQHQYQAGHGMSFGTDNSFTGGRFQSATPTHHAEHKDKEGNLLNVPGAEQATKRPMPYRTMSDQQQNGSQGQDNSRPPVNGGSNAAQWGNMSSSSRQQVEGEFAEPRDRKRRKSAEDQGELQTTPYQGRAVEGAAAGGSSHKRRKSSTANSQDDNTRSKKKMRETLTDAEKRQHHIESEKKRRELIHGGFKDLEGMVPCLQPGKSGLSRSEILQEIASYLETLKVGNMHLAGQLQSQGLDTTAQLAPHPPPHIKTEEGTVGHIFAA